jgi:hypothetical protein
MLTSFIYYRERKTPPAPPLLNRWLKTALPNLSSVKFSGMTMTVSVIKLFRNCSKDDSKDENGTKKVFLQIHEFGKVVGKKSLYSKRLKKAKS